MRDETVVWLSILEDAARERDIDVERLKDQAIPVQDGTRYHDFFVKRTQASDSEIRSVERDFVRY